MLKSPTDAAIADLAGNEIALASAINQAGQAVVITDRHGVILYINAAFTSMTGYSSPEVLGQNPRILKSGNQAPRYYRDLWSTITAGRSWHGELVNRRKDGSHYIEEMTIAPVRDSSGEIVRFIAVKQDVTEHRQGEEGQQLLAALVASSDDAIYSITLDGIISSWNAGAENVYGYSRAELLGKPISILLPSDRLCEQAVLLDGIQSGRKISQFETIRIRKDGRLVDVSLSTSPIRNAAGTIVGAATIARDISAWKGMQQALRESEANYRAIFETSRDAILIADAQTGMVLDANPAAMTLLGRSIEEIRRLHQSEIHPRDEAKVARDSFQEHRQEAGAREYSILRPDGGRAPVEISAGPMRDARGRELVLGILHDLSERKRAEAALQESEARFRIMADSCPIGIWVTGVHGRTLFANRVYREYTGITSDQIDPDSWQSSIHPEDAPAFIEAFQIALTNHTRFRWEHRSRRADGEWRWVESLAEPRFSSQGDFLGLVGTSKDINERREAEEALRASEEKFRQLTENIREVFWMMNAAGTEVLYVSPAYEEIWGRTCDELYCHPMSWIESIEPEDRELAHATFLRQMQGERIESEYRIRNAKGESKWVRDRAFPIRNEAGEIVRVAGIAEEISERKKAEAALAHQAQHDYLTGLPNRVLLCDRLEASIGRAAKSGLIAAIIYIDLDNFKLVNDTLGHEAGDTLLQLATERLQRCIREFDTLARMGGDEFMVVVNEITGDQMALAIAERLRTALQKTFHLAGNELHVSASLGVAIYPRDGRDVSALRRNADAAMYSAKRGGKDRVQLFSSEMRDIFVEHFELEADLRHALESNDQLSLVYQPIFEARGHRQTAFEALLRWTHPVLGSLSPVKFVPIAEESGLIFRLGLWALQQACGQCRIWQDQGHPGVRVAVNVSALEFSQPEFAANVLHTLERCGLPGHLLDLEVTETALMREVGESIRKMSMLRARGIRISIDDFGTGYSSLGYLAQLPVDTLKIDRSFIARLALDSNSRSLVEGMISLAHSLGKRVIVEGVESSEQLRILKALGSDEIQGFLLGRPVPLVGSNSQAARKLVPSGLAESGPAVTAGSRSIEPALQQSKPL